MENLRKLLTEANNLGLPYTTRALQVLAELYAAKQKREVLSVNDLADRCEATKPTISRSVSTLVARGLATRTERTKDRRSVDLGITVRGGVVLRRLAGAAGL